MRLRDLDAYFIRYEAREETREQVAGDPETWHERGCPTVPFTGMRPYIVNVETLAEAQGIFLRCPICVHGPRGGHYLQVTFADRGVLPEQGCRGREGQPTRWQVSGTGLDDLATQPSILLHGGCNWHGYITNGDAA